MSGLVGRLRKIGAAVKAGLDAWHGKSLEELATDYVVHPKSLPYRLCDWLGEKTGTIILVPFLMTVGNCAEEIYFGLLKARREGKKLVVLWPYELPGPLKFRLTNIEVVNVESECRAISYDHPLTIVGRILLTAYFAFYRSLSLAKRILLGTHLSNVYREPQMGSTTLWHPEQVKTFAWDVVDSFEWQKQMSTPLKVYLHKRKMIAAEGQRKKLGLPDDAWFACLHVRESGFHKDQFSERNANIHNYLDAIKEITGRGGWVVRMGDASMTRLPEMERVIDYPFTDVKNELMDVYLISQCNLYIGMISGIYDVARLFQRPIIMTNMNNWLFTFPILEGDLGIMKHVYSKRKERFLSLQEWLEEPWAAVSFFGMSDDYIFHENTPEELRSVVVEYFERGSDWRPTLEQEQFNELRIRTGKQMLGTPIFTAETLQPSRRKYAADVDLVQRYRLASRLVGAVGMMGNRFLQQTWEVDTMNGRKRE